MDLAIASGRGPAILTALDDGGLLVHDEDVAAVGARDGRERDEAGSQDIRRTGVTLLELSTVRERGIDAVAGEAIKTICRPETSGFWCHVDADVLKR